MSTAAMRKLLARRDRGELDDAGLVAEVRRLSAQQVSGEEAHALRLLQAAFAGEHKTAAEMNAAAQARGREVLRAALAATTGGSTVRLGRLLLRGSQAALDGLNVEAVRDESGRKIWRIGFSASRTQEPPLPRCADND